MTIKNVLLVNLVVCANKYSSRLAHTQTPIPPYECNVNWRYGNFRFSIFIESSNQNAFDRIIPIDSFEKQFSASKRLELLLESEAFTNQLSSEASLDCIEVLDKDSELVPETLNLQSARNLLRS